MNLKNFLGDSTGFEATTSAIVTSQLCDFVAQLVRALHRHRRGHGFESVVSKFFRFMRQLLKTVQQVRGSYLHLILYIVLCFLVKYS